MKFAQTVLAPRTSNGDVDDERIVAAVKALQTVHPEYRFDPAAGVDGL